MKYKGVKLLHLAFLSSFLFVSPSLRSLIIWPYSLSWGLFFFVISIYFFLKYEKNLNLCNSLKIISSLAIASYIYPSFAVFYLFYIYKIFKNQNIKTFFLVIFLSLVISLPCFYYILSRDVISSFQESQGLNVSLIQSFNLSNKILIISTICFYILLPIINFQRIFEKILEIKKRNFI